VKWILLIFILHTASNVFAEQGIMDPIYLLGGYDFSGDGDGDELPILNDELSMIGEFGFFLANGNTNTSTITAKLITSQELTSWSYQVIADALYKQSQLEVSNQKKNETSAQNLFLSGQLDFKLTKPDNRLFIYGDYENNRFSGFRYQAALAAGWSSRLWHNQNSELKYSIGPGYAISEFEQSNSSADIRGLIVRAAIEYKRKFSDHATFRQFISVEAAEEFTKTKLDTSLSTKLTGTLAMKLSFIINIDTGVGQDTEEQNTETVVTLVYQFF
jgi:putative salt-induced outer membrane protein